MAGCVENRALRGAQYRGPSLKRNGTSYSFQVKLTFDGDGGFDVNVMLDGRSAMSGKYSPSDNPSFVASSRYYMSHGVYSKSIFKYEMKSKNLRAYRGR